MPSMSRGDGSLSTPFFERLKPLIPLLEVLSISQIENDVVEAASESGISDMQIIRIREVFAKLNGDRNEVMCYVVNLTLAAEGMKAIPHKTVRKKPKYD